MASLPPIPYPPSPAATRLPSSNCITCPAVSRRPPLPFYHALASASSQHLHEFALQRSHGEFIKEEGSGKPIVSLGKREFLGSFLAASASTLAVAMIGEACAEDNKPQFYELEGSDGVMALDIREGTGKTPQLGDKVAIHYYARLAAKQGWRFDSTYDHKDSSGAPEPYVFTLGSDTVIAGLDSAVQTMKEGGLRRVIIPPSQGYLNTSQEPIPPNDNHSIDYALHVLIICQFGSVNQLAFVDYYCLWTRFLTGRGYTQQFSTQLV